MHVPPELRPTLWRICRALSNPTRLKIFELLLNDPNQIVSSVAQKTKLSVSGACRCLRLLESRGLLEARRIGRSVQYKIGPVERDSSNRSLILALRVMFKRNRRPAPIVYRLVTAFTHPRRIEILRVLKGRASTLDGLRRDTRMSLRALRRNLAKLIRSKDSQASPRGLFYRSAVKPTPA